MMGCKNRMIAFLVSVLVFSYLSAAISMWEVVFKSGLVVSVDSWQKRGDSVVLVLNGHKMKFSTKDILLIRKRTEWSVSKEVTGSARREKSRLPERKEPWIEEFVSVKVNTHFVDFDNYKIVTDVLAVPFTKSRFKEKYKKFIYTWTPAYVDLNFKVWGDKNGKILKPDLETYEDNTKIVSKYFPPLRVVQFSLKGATEKSIIYQHKEMKPSKKRQLFRRFVSFYPSVGLGLLQNKKFEYILRVPDGNAKLYKRNDGFIAVSEEKDGDEVVYEFKGEALNGIEESIPPAYMWQTGVLVKKGNFEKELSEYLEKLEKGWLNAGVDSRERAIIRAFLKTTEGKFKPSKVWAAKFLYWLQRNLPLRTVFVNNVYDPYPEKFSDLMNVVFGSGAVSSVGFVVEMYRLFKLLGYDVQLVVGIEPYVPRLECEFLELFKTFENLGMALRMKDFWVIPNGSVFSSYVFDKTPFQYIFNKRKQKLISVKDYYEPSFGGSKKVYYELSIGKDKGIGRIKIYYEAEDAVREALSYRGKLPTEIKRKFQRLVSYLVSGAKVIAYKYDDIYMPDGKFWEEVEFEFDPKDVVKDYGEFKVVNVPEYLLNGYLGMPKELKRKYPYWLGNWGVEDIEIVLKLKNGKFMSFPKSLKYEKHGLRVVADTKLNANKLVLKRFIKSVPYKAIVFPNEWSGYVKSYVAMLKKLSSPIIVK